MGWVAGAGRLPHNPYIGVRTMAALTDERTWKAAHDVAGPWWLAAGVVGVAAGSVVALVSPSAGASRLDVGLVALVMFVLAGIGAVRGDAAARRALGPDDPRSERRPPRRPSRRP